MCVGIPGQVVAAVPGAPDFLRVSVSGVERSINAGLLDGPPPRPGDWVMIHMGFALERMSAEEATESLALLADLGEGPDGANDDLVESAPWSLAT
jgi:hydrogenase expression/formation protein HypC